MKPSWNKKYTTIAIYCAIVLLFAIFSVFFFINYGKFDEYIEAIWKAIRSIIYGAIIAYLLWPVLKFFENKVFAFLTGDDKIPTIPEKPEIPTVPEIPEKPSRPVFDKSVSVIEKQRILLEYDEQMREYKRQMREYKRLLAAKKHAESTIAKIEKKTPRLEIKIAKVTARHERIRSRCYNDGAKRTRFGLRRALSVLMTVIVMIILIALFIYMVVPQIVSGYNDLTVQLPKYAADVSAWLGQTASRTDFIGDIFSDIVKYVNELISNISSYIQSAMPTIGKAIGNVFNTIKDVGIGIFFAIYFLLGKERVVAKFKKLIRSILKDTAYTKFSKVGRDLNKNFGSFITAKLIDSLIIGILTFIGMLILNLPYSPLIAVVIGVTNVIPMFGPFIGAIPSAFIIFIVDPMKALVFVIFIIILQQFDGNVLGPRLLGAQTNTTSLGILTALTVLSSFWGITGLIIAVPIFAVVYTLIKEHSEKRLQKKGASVDTADYYEQNDYIGRALHEEQTIKKNHKNTLRQTLSNSGAGDAALRLKIVSNLVDKVDETDEHRKANGDDLYDDSMHDDSAEEFLKSVDASKQEESDESLLDAPNGVDEVISADEPQDENENK